MGKAIDIRKIINDGNRVFVVDINRDSFLKLKEYLSEQTDAYITQVMEPTDLLKVEKGSAVIVHCEWHIFRSLEYIAEMNRMLKARGIVVIEFHDENTFKWLV